MRAAFSSRSRPTARSSCRPGSTGTDADPVDPGRQLERAVGLDRDEKAARMQRVDEGPVHLKRWLAAGQDDEPALALLSRPQPVDRRGKRARRLVLSAAGAVHAGEIRVAELAHGACAVFFAPGPQVAAGETAKDRG